MQPDKLLFEILTCSAPVVLSVGIVIGAPYVARLDPVQRILFGYVAAAWAIDILTRIIGVTHRNNLVFIPLFGIVELGLFTHLYCRHLLTRKSLLTFLLIAAAFAYMLFEVYEASWREPALFHAYSRVVGPVTIVGLGILYYREMGQTLVLQRSILHLNAAICIFFSLNMVFFLPVNFLVNEDSQLKFWFWIANLLLTLAFYVFLVGHLWQQTRKERHKHWWRASRT